VRLLYASVRTFDAAAVRRRRSLNCSQARRSVRNPFTFQACKACIPPACFVGGLTCAFAVLIMFQESQLTRRGVTPWSGPS
jgi:hypothetical protein